ncbi:MAG: FliM/FliN family flagellar motor switch protein [Proteobacteria bacterium]|nr:FliM/FliN family flagellar motor switch protein [Pseudomonadota bacterium]
MSNNNVLKNHLSLFDELEVELNVVLGTAKTQLKELMNAQQDSIITLDQAVDAPMKLMLNGHCVAEGELVTVEDNFAIKITKVMSH